MSEETAFSTSDDEVETATPVAERNATPHLAALGEKARDYARNARAENTQRAYDADWRQFSSWLRRQGFDPLPPNPQTVGLYLAACVDGGRGKEPISVATLERRLSGICWRYRQLGEPLDTSDRHISTVLAGIRRAHGRPPVQKEAIFTDDLRAMLATLDNDLRGLRDKAILAIGFAGGLRRSEIVGLDCGPNQSEDGTGWIEIFAGAEASTASMNARAKPPRKEKDDDAPDSGAPSEGGLLLTINGKTGWREVEIGRGSRPDTCPVVLLETWMRLGRVNHGPLFRPDRAQKRRRLLGAADRQTRRPPRAENRPRRRYSRRSIRGRTQARLWGPFAARRPRLLGANRGSPCPAPPRPRQR